MAAAPVKNEEKKGAKKEEKKEPRGLLMGAFLALLTFVVFPAVAFAAILTLVYMAFGGQITWHGI